MAIPKLPVEILVWIFRELRDMHAESRSQRWILVTHVCRTWRLVALEAAQLWTQICSSNPDCVQAFLARSRYAPLDILCYTKRDWTDAVVSMVLSESSRFRRIELVASGIAHEFFMHPFPGGIPLLTHLKLHSTPLPEPWPYRPKLGNVPVPPDILPRLYDHGLPASRQPDLEHQPVAGFPSLHSLFNSSLRSLVIEEPYTRHRPSTWADILAGLPLLEELSLTGVFQHDDRIHPDLEDVPPPTQEKIPLIPLPHLLYLKVVDAKPFQQLSFLRHIVPSENVHITFIITREDSLFGLLIPFECYTNILHVLSQKFTQEPQNLKTSIHSMSLIDSCNYDGRSNNVSVTLSTAAGNDTKHVYCARSESFSRPKNTVLKLSFAGVDSANGNLFIPLSNMLRTTFTWSTLHGLSLDWKHPITSPPRFVDFNGLFLQMTNLRVLSICEYHTDRFVELLGPLDMPIGPGSTTQVLFPVLEHLTVIDWRHIRQSQEYKRIHRALLFRKDAGFLAPRVHMCTQYWWGIRESDNADEKIKASVIPLTSIGCHVEVCVKRSGSWYIKEFAPA